MPKSAGPTLERPVVALNAGKKGIGVTTALRRHSAREILDSSLRAEGSPEDGVLVSGRALVEVNVEERLDENDLCSGVDHSCLRIESTAPPIVDSSLHLRLKLVINVMES